MNYISHLKTQDPILAKIIKPKLEKLPGSENIFISLLESIVSQQLSSKVAKIIWQRFQSLFENNYPDIEDLIIKSDNELRTAGLSRQKIGYLRNVAEFWKSNKLAKFNFEKESDEQIINLLTQIKGVGMWTVEMILIFDLKREDVFAVDDLALFNSVVKLYKLENLKLSKRDLKKKVVEISEVWKPYRSFASRYLWKYYMSEKK